MHPDLLSHVDSLELAGPHLLHLHGFAVVEHSLLAHVRTGLDRTGCLGTAPAALHAHQDGQAEEDVE